MRWSPEPQPPEYWCGRCRGGGGSCSGARADRPRDFKGARVFNLPWMTTGAEPITSAIVRFLSTRASAQLISSAHATSSGAGSRSRRDRTPASASSHSAVRAAKSTVPAARRAPEEIAIEDRSEFKLETLNGAQPDEGSWKASPSNSTLWKSRSKRRTEDLTR